MSLRRFAHFLIGGPGAPADSPVMPQKVPSRLYSPPTSEDGERPGIELRSDKQIIALKSLSGQDKQVDIDDVFFQET